ncbi:MAG: calcium/sodium antiporter [Candidatus Aenigmatarchaeota archaeon]
MYELAYLVLGILGLLLGTELVIRSSLDIAEHYKISHVFMGLTIIAIGTDLPELVVNITGALYRLAGTETSGLIIGQTIGTTISQIALILGIIGLASLSMRPSLTKRELRRDGMMMLGSVVLLFLVGLDGIITTQEGLMLVIIYLLYFSTLFREERVYEKVKRAPRMHIRWALVSLITGFIVLIYSSDFVVSNAVSLAVSLGVAQSLIGALVLGVGTSLPELSISLGAIRKKAVGLSVGNLIGSNTYDILFTLGISSAISGFIVNENLLRFDIPFLFLVSVLALFFFKTKMKISRKEAAALIGVYAIYVALKIAGF